MGLATPSKAIELAPLAIDQGRAQFLEHKLMRLDLDGHALEETLQLMRGRRVNAELEKILGGMALVGSARQKFDEAPGKNSSRLLRAIADLPAVDLRHQQLAVVVLSQ